MAKATAITETAWKGPVHIVPLGWGLTATFVVLFVLCFLAALLFPNAELTHNWLSLYSTRPMGSVGQLIEGVIWNVVFAWVAAVIFGLVYNSLAPKA
jgi:cell shape-determining protein MreD